MKIATILGARPQFVKASIVSDELSSHNSADEFLIHTGQHYDSSMSDIFFSQLSIKKPKYNLNISGTSHGDMTGRMIIATEEVLIKEKPDLVLVYGDTNSTLAAAIAASKLMIPIAHVEAGLRSWNMRMPEEINRILTDKISDLLFTPCVSAGENLLKEGVTKDKIFKSGDVMLDVLQKTILSSAEKNIFNYDLNPNSYALLTIHRQENTDDNKSWNKILEFISNLSDALTVLWPVHPRVSSKIPKFILDNNKIKLIEPLGYIEMLHATKNSKFVITDSGGLQKEAFFLQTPCITIRSETEWNELIDSGWNKLLPPDLITKDSVESVINFNPSGITPEIYGNGNAAKIIASEIIKY